MADLGDGYTRIANELLEELARRKLNGTQASIVFFILRQTYGFQRKCYEMSLSFIAGGIGAHKDQVKRNLNELIKFKVIRVFKEAGFSKSRSLGLNSKCSEWQIPVYRGLSYSEGMKESPPKNEVKEHEEPVLFPDSEALIQETESPPGEGVNKSPGRGLDRPQAQGTGSSTKERYSFKDNYKDIIYTIFKHWNSKKIVVHRELTNVTESAIKARLKVSSKEDIIDAIDNYHFCLKSEDHFYSYKFNLKDFMNPKNLERFFTENDPFNNFLNRSTAKKKAAPVSDDQFRKRLEELESENN